MTIFYSTHHFEVLEFYHYPTTVVDRMVEWDEGFHKNSPNNVEDVKDFFEDILKKVETTLNKNLRDNKIAFKIRHIPTNTIMYVGYKDWNWSLGLRLNTYVEPEMINIQMD